MRSRGAPPPISLRFWWHGIPALPMNARERAYFVLRRVWGDHTMAGARGFHHTTSEDHVTATLFQMWALFPDHAWVESFVRACGGDATHVTDVSWAYACEEIIDASLQPYHGRNFVIADIMLRFSDAGGDALLAIEAKKPGVAAVASDSRKLKTYCDLPSTRAITRRYGCFLVGASSVTQTVVNIFSEWPVISWEQLRKSQLAATDGLLVSESMRGLVRAWIARHHSRHGVGAVMPPPPPIAGTVYASEESYAAIRQLRLPPSIEAFLLGSECTEVAMTGGEPEPPFAWLAAELSADDIRLRKHQTTAERRIVRWRRNWHSGSEPVWA